MNVFPTVRSYILVSGDSDRAAPSRHYRRLPDPKILHWFAMNCDRDTSDSKRRLSCLPLGVSQW